MRIEQDLAYALDPVSFARNTLGFDPDPWQARALEDTQGRLVFNCSRQAGKSTVAAAKACHTALYRADSLILLTSPSERQSKELFRKVGAFLDRVGRDRAPLDEDNRTSCQLDNGSRIVSLPGSPETIRGYSGADLVILDEAAYSPDALYEAIRPMVAVSKGQMLLMSTPFGKRGFFHDVWINGENWLKLSIPATECPRITAEFLAEERKSMPLWVFLREYMCEFGETAGAIFTYELFQGALSEDVQPLQLGKQLGIAA